MGTKKLDVLTKFQGFWKSLLVCRAAFFHKGMLEMCLLPKGILANSAEYVFSNLLYFATPPCNIPPNKVLHIFGQSIVKFTIYLQIICR